MQVRSVWCSSARPLSTLLDGTYGQVWQNMCKSKECKCLFFRSGLPILAKVCTDQFVFAPVIGTSFFLGLAVLDGKRDGLMALWQEKVPAAWATGLCVWPLLAGVSYTWVPMHLRPPFISVCRYMVCRVGCVLI